MTNLDQIRALAAQGIGRLNIEATIGHRFDPAELAAFRKAVTIRQLKAAQRKAHRQRVAEELDRQLDLPVYQTASDAPLFDQDQLKKGIAPRRPLTALERQHRHREAAREISRDFAEATRRIDWSRRRAALADFRKFIVTYCMGDGGLFEYEPFAETARILDTMVRASASSTPYHLRITRGGGKTTIMIALAAFLLARHEKDFIVLVAAKADAAQQMVADLADLFVASHDLANDFPELSFPLVALGGSMQKAATQRFLGRPTLCRATGKILRFPMLASGCPLLKGFSGGAVVVATGFDGRTRGLRIGKRRPDFILLDDLQSDDMADNPQRVEDARRKIYKTFLKLGSAVERPAVLMTSTPIAADDLSESIANDPNFKTETFPLMTSMPTKAALELWRTYRSIRNSEIISGNFSAHSELQFYVEHRAAMDEGAVPFWHDCYNRDGTEISAIQHAMNLFLEDEESFLSEYQMKPRRATLAIDLPRRRVLENVLRGAPRLAVPNGFVFVCAATDINPSYALTTVVAAFKPDRTCFILDHLLSPLSIDGKTDDTTFNALLFNALNAHTKALANLPVKIAAHGIDASGRQFATVPLFTKSSPLPSCAMMGRAQTKFNPFVRTRLRDALNATVLCADDVERAAVASGRRDIGIRYMLWDADKYKEAVHRGFLADPGAPGSCSLFDGGDHTDFAIQITNEKLVGKRPHGDGRDEFVWNSADPHDFLDALAMCYAIAGANGISGQVRSPVRRIRKRPKIVIR